jgi:hypothetical protein
MLVASDQFGDSLWLAPRAPDRLIRIHQRAAVEAMCGQAMHSMALRGVIRPITTRVGNLFVVLLDGPSEGV